MRRTPLRRSTKPLPRRSAKAAEVARKRRVLAARFGPLCSCEFPGCNYRAGDMHERRLRSQGGDPTDPANIVLLCAGPGTPDHHDWVHHNRKEARRLGLILHTGDAR